jgi:hypothetical protein
MMTREDAARLAEELLETGADKTEHVNRRMSPFSQPHHFGKTELRILLDGIYGGKPATDAEKIK